MTRNGNEPDTPTLATAKDFAVGDWIFRTSHNRLRARSGTSEISIEPRQSALFLALIRRNGELVTRDDLIAEVWDGVEVSDDSLAQSISRLRKALGDTPRNSKYIETIWKTGYRWIGPVEPVAVGNGFAKERWRRGNVAIAGGLGLLTIVAAAIWTLPDSRNTPKMIELVPIATAPAMESSPTISDDGKRVAYVVSPQMPQRAYLEIRNMDDGAVYRITTEGDSRSPSWSQDGTRIAFMAYEGEQCTIRVSRHPFEVTSIIAGCNDSVYPDLAWSPAGEIFAYSARESSKGANAIRIVTAANELTLTSPPDTVWGDFDPAFSPAGERLTFTRAVTEMRHDLYLINSDGSEPERLTYSENAILGSTWLPDGNTILFATNNGGRYLLKQIDIGSGAITPVAVAVSDIIEPNVNRSGDIVATSRNFDTTILAIHPESGRTMQVPFNSTHWDLSPSLSADGKTSLFVSDRSGSFQVWSSKGRDPARQLTDFAGNYIAAARFDPKGNGYYFEGRDDDDFGIFHADSDAGTTQRVTPPDVKALALTVSADGNYVFFASDESGEWQIWKMSVDSKALVQVTREGGFASSEGPDGRHLYFTKPYETGIWQAVDGAEPKRFDNRLAPDDGGAFVAIEEGVLFLDRNVGQFGALVLREHEGTNERVIHSLETPSPSFDRVLYADPKLQSIRLVAQGPITADILLGISAFAGTGN